MKKYITDFTLVEKKIYNTHYFSLVLLHPGMLPDILPGQFVEVEVKNCKNVYLRRPISIHDIDRRNNTLSLLIQVIGKGTEALSQLQINDKVNLIYPLGKGFSIEGNNVLLIGGGCGLAPLLYVARKYSEQGIRANILLGGRTAELIPAKEEFADFGTIYYATEDGSLGEKGLVTQHSVFKNSYDKILTCGPNPMMKAIARYANQHNIICEVSLENTMACGIGACLCCVTDTDMGHKCVCKEGPVFNSRNLIKWANN